MFDVHTALPLFWFPVLHDSSSHRFNDGFYSVYFICQKLSNDNHNVPDYGTHTNRRSSRAAVIEYPIGRSLHKIHTTHYVYQYWQFFGRRLAYVKEKQRHSATFRRRVVPERLSAPVCESRARPNETFVLCLSRVGKKAERNFVS